MAGGLAEVWSLRVLASSSYYYDEAGNDYAKIMTTVTVTMMMMIRKVKAIDLYSDSSL